MVSVGNDVQPHQRLQSRPLHAYSPAAHQLMMAKIAPGSRRSALRSAPQPGCGAALHSGNTFEETVMTC
jgi:hypothetical protein